MTKPELAGRAALSSGASSRASTRRRRGRSPSANSGSAGRTRAAAKTQRGCAGGRRKGRCGGASS
eukprot:13644037-Alexandrium_andersonii.AAC.1